MSTTRDVRRLCVESLDARVVLSANSFVGAAFVGPAIAGDLPAEAAATFAMRATSDGLAREFNAFRDGFAGEHRFDSAGPGRSWIDNHQNFGAQNSFERAGTFKPNSPGSLDLEYSSGQSFVIRQGFGTIGRRSFDGFNGFGNTSFGNSSLLVIDLGSQGGFVDLYVGRPQSGGVILVSSQWLVVERPASRFLIERIYESPGGRDDLVSKSQAPSPPAYISSLPAGGGKQSSPISEGGTITIASRPPSSQLATSQVFTTASTRGALELAAVFASPTTTTTSVLGRSDETLSTVLTPQVAGRTFGATSEGGLIDIGANLNSGKLSLPRLSADPDLDSASPADGKYEHDQDIAQFWSDLGEDLESLDPAELVLDANAPQIDSAVDHDASEAVSLVDQALAIHNGEGGMVELSVNRPPATTLPSTDVRATPQVPRQAKPKTVEIEMDAAVAMFQAFEIETAPTSERRAAEDESETSDAESADTDTEKPPAQPVDRASLGPLSIVFAVATSAVRDRDRKAQQQRLALGK